MTVDPQNQPHLGSRDVANITIDYNDHPYGLFELKVDVADADSNGSKYTVLEPMGTSVPVQFHIERGKGREIL